MPSSMVRKMGDVALMLKTRLSTGFLSQLARIGGTTAGDATARGIVAPGASWRRIRNAPVTAGKGT